MKIHVPPLASDIPAQIGDHVVTPELLVDIPKGYGFYTVRWLNDSQLLYTVTDKTIELLDIHTNTKKILCKGSHPEPSPDGRLIAFTKKQNNITQLWVMDSKGKNTCQVTKFSEGLTGDSGFHYSYKWSPDSKSLALYYRQKDIPYYEEYMPFKKTEISADSDKTSALIFCDVNASQPQPPYIIEVIEISTLKSRKLLSTSKEINYLSWFGNGEELLFSSAVIESYGHGEEDKYQIQALNVKSTEIRVIAEFDGLQQFLFPTASPDGSKVAFMADFDNPEFTNMLSLGVVLSNPQSDNSVKIKRVTEEMTLYAPRWSRDGSLIYVVRMYGPYSNIWAVNVKTVAIIQITNTSCSIKNYVVSKDGKHIAWLGIDPQAKIDIFIANSDGSNAKKTAVFSAASEAVALSEVREVEWKSPNYPVAMRGLLLLPLNYVAGKKYPLVVYIHGGGPGAHISMGGSIVYNSALEWQLWTAKGYAVFIPEFRSSCAFGSLAITRDERQNYDLVNQDINDVVAGVDMLVSQGIVDSKRVGVIGRSAGARRVNWLIVSTNKFATAVSIDGWANEWFAFGTTFSKRIASSYGGPQCLVPERYQKNSSLVHANRALA